MISVRNSDLGKVCSFVCTNFCDLYLLSSYTLTQTQKSDTYNESYVRIYKHRENTEAVE